MNTILALEQKTTISGQYCMSITHADGSKTETPWFDNLILNSGLDNIGLSQSDVIFAYTRSGSLYWRQQRDRYDVERLVGLTTKPLIRLGLASTNRLQFECMS